VVCFLFSSLLRCSLFFFSFACHLPLSLNSISVYAYICAFAATSVVFTVGSALCFHGSGVPASCKSGQWWSISNSMCFFASKCRTCAARWVVSFQGTCKVRDTNLDLRLWRKSRRLGLPLNLDLLSACSACGTDRGRKSTAMGLRTPILICVQCLSEPKENLSPKSPRGHKQTTKSRRAKRAKEPKEPKDGEITSPWSVCSPTQMQHCDCATFWLKRLYDAMKPMPCGKLLTDQLYCTDPQAQLILISF